MQLARFEPTAYKIKQFGFKIGSLFLYFRPSHAIDRLIHNEKLLGSNRGSLGLRATALPTAPQPLSLHVSNTEILSRFEIGHCSTEHPQPSKGETVEQEVRKDKEI